MKTFGTSSLKYGNNRRFTLTLPRQGPKRCQLIRLISFPWNDLHQRAANISSLSFLRGGEAQNYSKF